LNEIPPFLFAAVRYFVAFSVLAVMSLVWDTRTSVGQRKASIWSAKWSLFVAGICGFTLAQGLQFLGLFYLSAITTSFILNLTPVFVFLLGILFLGERASRLQLFGLAVALVGSFAFFLGKPVPTVELLGVLIVTVSGLSWAIYLVITRSFQRADSLGSLKLTTVTMGIGTGGLVFLAAAFEGIRPISYNGFGIILWLSTVNTAFAFLLWNHALKFIRAYELSVLQNSMMVEVAVFAWIFLGEQITPIMFAGMGLVILGIILVQFPALRRT
jgi:drug/metabolite transporter (DMT)-like permease